VQSVLRRACTFDAADSHSADKFEHGTAVPHSVAPFNTSALTYDFAAVCSVSAAPTRSPPGLPTGHAPLYPQVLNGQYGTTKTLTLSLHRG
jgi:hypothetical protein